MSSQDFLGKPYKQGGDFLEAGDIVWVHPTDTSQSREKYQAVIRYENGELGTFVSGGHFSIMREYLFNRLEKIQ